MNDIVKRPEAQLSATLEDLSKFVLVGREKLIAVRAEIRAIEKVGLAQAVREQKLKEGQAISEAVLDAEVRIGQLMRDVPKSTINNPVGKNQYNRGQKDSGVVLTKTQSIQDTPEPIISKEETKSMRTEDKPEAKVIAPKTEEPKTEAQEQAKAQALTKAEIIRQAGFTPKHVQRFQTMAEHPEIVEQAKREAEYGTKALDARPEAEFNPRAIEGNAGKERPSNSTGTRSNAPDSVSC